MIKIENRGGTADLFRIRGPHSRRAFLIGYRTGWTGHDITRRVTSGREQLLVPRRGHRYIRLVVTATARAWRGLRRAFLVVARSKAFPSHRDAVRARVRVVLH
jgi:hypothetical protein